MTDKPSRDDVLRIAGECGFWINKYGCISTSEDGELCGEEIYRFAAAMYAAGAESEREVSDNLATALQRIAKLRIVEADEIIDDYIDLITEVAAIRATHTNREQADTPTTKEQQA